MKKFILSVVVAGLSVGVLAAGPGGKGNGNGGGGGKGNGPNNGSGLSGGFKPSGSPSVGIKPSHVGGSPLVGIKPSHIGGSPKGNWKGGFNPGHAYVQKYAKPFSGGFCYQGKAHCHWTYSCYSKKYGCSCYWCPYTTCYYYWSEPACCYYPVSYIAVAPPVIVTYAAPVQVQTQTQVQVQTQTQTQGPPAGIPPLPE